MFKKTTIALSIGIIAFRAMKRLSKDKVERFETHIIEEGENLEIILKKYNSLFLLTPIGVSDIVRQIQLLNPHNKTFEPGSKVIIPVFAESSMKVAYSFLQVDSQPPKKYKSLKRLDAEIYSIQLLNPKASISVMDFNAAGNLVDQFIGEAHQW